MTEDGPEPARAERAIRTVIREMVDCWNRRDWRSFGRLFADDADYVTGDGVRLTGRGRIEDALSSRAEDFLEPGRVGLVAESVKLLRPDVAVVLCRWRMDRTKERGAGDARLRAGLLTMVVQGGSGGWRIVALQNTDRAE